MKSITQLGLRQLVELLEPMWSTDMGQGAAFYVTTSSGPADGTSFISAATGGGFTTFQGGIALQYGPSLTISAMTLSSTIPQITTTANHNLVSGDVVVFQNLYQTTSTGQVQLCNIPFVVTYVSATAFTIAINNNVTGYTALSSPVGGTVKQLLYPNLYAPGVSFIAGVNTSTTCITTTAPHNFVVGQEVAFRVPTAFGTTQLNTLPNILTPGSPNYYFVRRLDHRQPLRYRKVCQGIQHSLLAKHCKCISWRIYLASSVSCR